jgi:hypothetical protein
MKSTVVFIFLAFAFNASGQSCSRSSLFSTDDCQLQSGSFAFHSNFFTSSTLTGCPLDGEVFFFPVMRPQSWRGFSDRERVNVHFLRQRKLWINIAPVRTSILC